MTAYLTLMPNNEEVPLNQYLMEVSSAQESDVEAVASSERKMQLGKQIT
jgi:hypothetical protein